MPLMRKAQSWSDAGEGVWVPSVPMRSSLEALPGEAEFRRIRNQDWYQDHCKGRVEPDGRREKRSVRRIAGIYGVHPDTVYEGIKAHRDLMELVTTTLQAEGEDPEDLMTCWLGRP
jgi:hypothetical protein